MRLPACVIILMSNTHRRRRRDLTVELRRVGGVNRIRNKLTTSRRLPTNSVDSSETDPTDSIVFDYTSLVFIDIYNFFQQLRHYVVTCHQPQ